MALTALTTALVPVLPCFGLYACQTALGSASTFTFNGAGDKLGFVFTAQTTDVPDLVSFWVSGFTTLGTIDATLETLDASGLPTGTAVSGSATASVSVTATGIKNTATGMAGTAAVTVGTEYAIVLTATALFVGNFIVTYSIGSSQGWTSVPYCLSKDSAGSWTKTNGTNSGYNIGVKNAGGSYFQMMGYPGCFNDFSLQAFSSSTNPDERGNRFVPAVNCTLVGALIFYNGGSAPGTNDDYQIYLYSAPTTAISQMDTVAFDGDAQNQGFLHYLPFTTPQNLTAGTEYGITLRAQGSDNANIPMYTFQATGDLAGHLGADFYSITRNDGSGNASAGNTKAYTVYPIYSKFDNAAQAISMPVSGRICA